ncbi:MAG: hypothetical protein QM619_09295 [Micropruina sp.]|uniref:hypothetical protein n=1 Tax=Micropruina sp. TaxID=2737536 RepID=UPI0039E5256C
MNKMRVSLACLIIATASAVTAGCASIQARPAETAEPVSTASTTVRPLGDTTGTIEIVAPAVSSSPCSENAAVTIGSDASDSIKEMIADNPASNSHAGPVALADADSAVAAARTATSSYSKARSMGWEPPAEANAAAVLLPYQATVKAAGADIPEGQQIVDPDRCVWLVTVEEPYIQQHVKAGVTPKVFDRYTRVIDQATGEGLDLYAGADAPDAITGAHL